MKHTWSVSLIVLAVFFVAQVLGLVIINNYVNHQALTQTGNVTFRQLPLGMQTPQTQGVESFITIMLAVLIGTVLALALIRFNQHSLWKIWFLVAIFVTLTVAFGSFFSETIAIVLAALFALWKVFRPNIYVHNLTELFIYGGLAAIFVNMLNILAAVLLLLFISAYDAYAVWKSKHMITLAKFQTDSKLFAGVLIPYKLPKSSMKSSKSTKTKRVKTAILGGGDIGFPLLFAGVLFKELLAKNSVSVALAEVLIVPICATLALGWLLYKGQKDKFYPAMPFISTGCFIGLAIMHFLGFL